MPSPVLTNMTNAGFGQTANASQPTSLTRNYTYDAANRLNNWNYNVNVVSSIFPVQTDTYTYDNNGNRLTKQAVLTGQESTPQQTAYTYDFENRLNQLQYTNIPGITGTQTDSITYNGEGLRRQVNINTAITNGSTSLTTSYFYDGTNILVERDSSGNNTKTYTRGLDTGGGIGSIIAQNYTSNSTPVTQYYDYNDLGSASEVTTSMGTTAASYNYDAFGNLLAPQASGDTNRYLFSTKEFDARSGLYYFGARYYDPEIGRWLTPDPLGMVDGPNVYLYVNNNPVNLIDPYGLMGEHSTWWQTLGKFFFDSDTFKDSIKLWQASSDGTFNDYSLRALAVIGILSTAADTGFNFLSGGEEGTVKGVVKITLIRKNPGKDLAISSHIVEKLEGETISVTHQVKKDDVVIHQHQTHVGKYGTRRQFPDSWIEYPKID